MTEAREIRQQIEQITYFDPESVGKFLFDEEADKIHLINELTPQPSMDKLLMIFRISSDEVPVRGFVLGLEDKPLEELGRKGEKVNDLLRDFREDLGFSKRKLGGVVIFFDKGIGLEEVEGDLQELVVQLAFETRVWSVEPDLIRASREEKELKKDFLLRVGLAERKSVSAKSGFCFSTGRLSKKGERSPVDLTSHDWLQPILKEVIREYEEAGWKVISTSGARGKLKESTFVPDDLRKLKLGFGSRIEAPCGCQWRVDFKDGAWERQKKCLDFGCEGYPPPKLEPEEKLNLTRKEPPFCAHCEEPMERKKGGGYHCPHCEWRTGD